MNPNSSRLKPFIRCNTVSVPNRVDIDELRRLHDDVVDWDVEELDEEADETHESEANGRGDGDLLELYNPADEQQVRAKRRA